MYQRLIDRFLCRGLLTPAVAAAFSLAL